MTSISVTPVMFHIELSPICSGFRDFVLNVTNKSDTNELLDPMQEHLELCYHTIKKY
jgi:hypothetical protein